MQPCSWEHLTCSPAHQTSSSSLCRYFYATLQLGTPPRAFAVIVDTGSTITYVPCSSCGTLCGPHHKARLHAVLPAWMHSSAGCCAVHQLRVLCR